MGQGPPNQGFQIQVVRVISVDTTVKKAVVVNSLGAEIEVRLDILAHRYQVPAAGEVWIISQTLGFWAFVAIMNPPGGTPPDVAALQTAVTALQASLASLLAGPGVATTAARSDILTAAGAMLLGQTFTNEWWMPARDFDASLGSPTYASFGSWATNQWGWHFPSAAQSGVIGHTTVPIDYSPGTTITGDIYFTCSAGGNCKIDAQAAAIRPGLDPMNTTGAIPPGASTIIAPTGLEQRLVTGIGSVAGTPVAGCVVNVAVDRDGVNGSDTNTSIVTFHGVRLRYTAVRI
jgi:hypothetical protein